MQRGQPLLVKATDLFHLQADFAEGLLLFVNTENDRTANHQPGQMRGARVGHHLLGRDHLSPAQHGHAVGKARHLIELMADEDDRLALLHHALHRLAQRVGLLRRQDRGRLIENQNVRAAIQRLQYLDPLLLANAQLPYESVRVHKQIVLFAHLHDPPLHPLHVQPQGPETPPLRWRAVGIIQPQNDVFGDSLIHHQFEMLVDHRDAQFERGSRRINVHREAV